MSRIFVTSLIILLSVVGISMWPVNHSETDVEKMEDYPSDTHAGAEKAFSQLVSDESGSSRANRDDDDEADASGKDTKSHANKNGNADLKLDEFDDSDDSETQYLIEEFYGYTYDEATDTDFDDSSSSKKNSFSANKKDYEKEIK